MKSKVLIRGVGVIGWSLCNLFLELKKAISDFEIYFEPYLVQKENFYYLLSLIKKGGIIVRTESNHVEDFSDFENHSVLDSEIKSQINLVLDCSPSGIAVGRISEYNTNEYPKAKAFIAQGSEHKFGMQIMFPESLSRLENTNENFFHIGTCNTHTLVAAIRNLDHLKKIDFVVIRRDADMAKNDPHVTGPLFQIPTSEDGTHHSKYVKDLYETIDKKFTITSSALTVNSPYMHVTRFNAEVEFKFTKEALIDKISRDPYSSISYQLSTNSIFSTGRDQGLAGRIYSHGVWILPCLEVSGNQIRGMLATPGDSNVILSTILSGLLLLKYPKFSDAKIFLQKFLLREI